MQSCILGDIRTIQWRRLFSPSSSPFPFSQSDVISGSTHKRSNKRSSWGSPITGSQIKWQAMLLGGQRQQCEEESGGARAHLRLHKARHLGQVRDQLDKSVCSAEFLPKRYVAIRKARTLYRGNVMIAIRQGLIVDDMPLKDMKEDCELAFARETLPGGAPPLSVGAYYRSQIDNLSNESLDGRESALHQVSILVSNSKTTVIFSRKYTCWDTLRSLPNNPFPSVSGKLIRISAENGLIQLKRQPTRQNSLLDLFFTSNGSLVSSIDIIPGISTEGDH